MQKIFPTILLLLAFGFSSAQSPQKFYVAAKAGLTLREKPSASAKMLEKVPYGEKIDIEYDKDTVVRINTEGLQGNWVTVTYKGKTGYLVDSYLLPEIPPKATVKTLKDYLAQISAPAGAPVITQRVFSEEMNTRLKKQLYKNNAELHEYTGYEYNSETCFLPDFTLEQGFILLRVLKVFPDAIAENDPYPTANSSKKLKDGERTITLIKKSYGAAQPVTERITIEWEAGATYQLELYLIDNQLVIFYSGGV